MKGVLSLNQLALTRQGDLYARILILAQKDVKVGSSVLGGSVDTGTLLKAGFGSTGDTVPFDGTSMALNYPINTDKFRVYMDKIVKFTLCEESAVEGVPRYSARWSYTFSKDKMPASLTFDTSNGDWCNNFAPFLAIDTHIAMVQYLILSPPD